MSSTEMATAGAQERLRTSVLLLLTIALLIVGGLRFSRADLLGTSMFAQDRYYTFQTDQGRNVENLNIDISQYLAMTEDFGGVEGAFDKQEAYEEFASNPDAVKGPVAPFIYRPALPFLASLLPLDAPDAFALVNLVLVVAGLWALVDALRVSGRSAQTQLLGGILYVVALPVLVFTSALYIDGGAMAVLVIGYWLLARRWWPLLVAFLPLSYLVKENLFVLAPSAALAWKVSGRSWRDRSFIVGATISVVGWVAVAVLVRSLAPDPVLSYSVTPKWSYFGGNLGNVTSMLFLAVGSAPVLVPAALGFWWAIRDRGLRGAFMSAPGPDMVGVLVVLAMNLYSMVSTDLTLRTMWLVWPFAIGLGAAWADGAVGDRWPTWTSRLRA